MLTVYLVCLLIGGTMIGSAALLGGHDHGHGDGLGESGGSHLLESGGADASPDNDVPAEHGGGDELGSAVLAPFLSVRFWTFFLGCFGLTGTVFTVLGLLASQTLILPLSLAMGLGSGYGISSVMARLRREVIDSSLQDQDYIGATGRVLLPIERSKIGKVRLQLYGRTVDMMAKTEDAQGLKIQQEVLVYGLEDGMLKVTNPETRQLGGAKEPDDENSTQK